MVVLDEGDDENQTSPRENIACQAAGRRSSASGVGVSEGTERRIGWMASSKTEPRPVVMRSEEGVSLRKKVGRRRRARCRSKVLEVSRR